MNNGYGVIMHTVDGRNIIYEVNGELDDIISSFKTNDKITISRGNTLNFVNLNNIVNIEIEPLQ